MSLVYASLDLAPYTCAVYFCACGRAAERHGNEGGLPEGWVEILRDAEPDHACPQCAKASLDPRRVTG